MERLKDKRFLSMLGSEYNLVWEALRYRNFFKEDEKKWRELLLSLTGTVLRTKDGRTVVRESLCCNEEWFRVFVGLEEGSLDLYRCSDERCLAVEVVTEEMKESLCAKIVLMLNELFQKIINGQPMTAQEKNFITSSRIPILRMLTVNAISRQEIISHEEMSHVVALDFVVRWVEFMMSAVEEAVNNIRSVQIDDTVFLVFLQNLQKARRFLYQHREGFYSHVKSVTSLIERARAIELKALSYAHEVL